MSFVPLCCFVFLQAKLPCFAVPLHVRLPFSIIHGLPPCAVANPAIGRLAKNVATEAAIGVNIVAVAIAAAVAAAAIDDDRF